MISEAEPCFKKAIQIARQQRAKSFELRATTSLARLLQSQNRFAKARQVMEKIYAWFSEGFDTLDLREAQELILDLMKETGSFAQKAFVIDIVKKCCG